MQKPDAQPDDHNKRNVENAAGGRILPFKRRAATSPPGSVRDDANVRRAILDEDRTRMRQNIAAAVVLICLMIAGGWCIAHLRQSLRIEICLEAGYRNCSELHG